MGYSFIAIGIVWMFTDNIALGAAFLAMGFAFISSDKKKKNKS